MSKRQNGHARVAIPDCENSAKAVPDLAAHGS